MNAETKTSVRKIGDRIFSAEDQAMLAIAAAMEKKATRPILIDLRPQGAFTEYFAIVSGNNPRQVSSIAESVRMHFKQVFGMLPIAADGFETSTWVLLDYGSFFVHVFQESTREIYKLEQLWSKGRFVELREEAVQRLYSEALALAPLQAISSPQEMASVENIEVDTLPE